MSEAPYHAAECNVSIDTCQSGARRRVARGLYRRTAAQREHDVGTQLPAKVWIAIPHKFPTPVAGLPVRVIRFSGASLRSGIEDAEFEGVPVRITSPARTILDCFRCCSAK